MIAGGGQGAQSKESEGSNFYSIAWRSLILQARRVKLIHSKNLAIAIWHFQEGIQCFALGIKRYVTEWENLLELLAIFLATAGLFLQHDMQGPD